MPDLDNPLRPLRLGRPPGVPARANLLLQRAVRHQARPSVPSESYSESATGSSPRGSGARCTTGLLPVVIRAAAVGDEGRSVTAGCGAGGLGCRPHRPVTSLPRPTHSPPRVEAVRRGWAASWTAPAAAASSGGRRSTCGWRMAVLRMVLVCGRPPQSFARGVRDRWARFLCASALSVSPTDILSL
jgi:hypothetical protein